MGVTDHMDAADYYDRGAAGFAARYNSVTFGEVHPLLARYLPDSGRALDIGAGSGRDARALAALGLNVTAVEPSIGLRNFGKASSPGIRWVDDRLPELRQLADQVGSYDLILCSAVLMLIAPDDLAPSFLAMAQLATLGGRQAINVRQPMAGEPANIFFAHTGASILTAAATAGLSCVERVESDDALGRAPYRWNNFIFERTI
ncbi:MAG: methyltransferase domain-containing protein [Hyphomicrobiales bacterium]|nr:MAG: methyltransferase domain-containing protein [Hyphomicrobiales bacterium]